LPGAKSTLGPETAPASRSVESIAEIWSVEGYPVGAGGEVAVGPTGCRSRSLGNDV